jgi:hypothetical protein
MNSHATQQSTRLRLMWRHIDTSPCAYPHELRYVHWCNSFMSGANLTGMTQRGQILKISFSLIHFSIFFKKVPKYKKI